MSRSLPPSASVAHAQSGDKLHAPAAERNSDALCTLLRDHAPAQGMALEIASGTGQHVVAFARTCPGVHWQPTEVEATRRASIDAYRKDAGLTNIAPAMALDATVPDWSKKHRHQALVVLINLLHLIRTDEAQTVVTQAVQALMPGGRFVLYGPFLRDGAFTSEGDQRFHAQLSGADPAIGYKDDRQIEAWLTGAGASDITRFEMPANNLAFIATR